MEEMIDNYENAVMDEVEVFTHHITKNSDKLKFLEAVEESVHSLYLELQKESK